MQRKGIGNKIMNKVGSWSQAPYRLELPFLVFLFHSFFFPWPTWETEKSERITSFLPRVLGCPAQAHLVVRENERPRRASDP